MDNQFSDSDKTLEITAEHAVLIPILPSIKSVMAYVEAVAVVIGSCHIHSVYEDHENIKIYLNDKRFVDILVNNGVTILGRRMNVDYAVPRADKVVLSNVDPIIPDAVLLKLLCFYGTPVSAIIHEKIATNTEYSHIECGKRKVYMKIFDDKKVPTKINFTYQEVCYQIDVLVEQGDNNGVCEALTEERSDYEGNEDLQEIESNISLKPNINDLILMKQPTPKQLAYRNRGKKNSQYSAALAARQIKRRARKGWYSARKVKRMANEKLSPKKGRRAKKVFNKVANSTGKIIKKGPRNMKKYKRGRSSAQSASIEDIDNDTSNSIKEVDINGLDQSSLTNGTSNEVIDANSITHFPLSFEELENFIVKTRFHREPVQVALEFLATNKSPDGLAALKTQLLEYHNVCKEQSVKLRIKRLVLSLQNAKSDETVE